MHKYSVLHRAGALLVLAAVPSLCLAVDTHIWEQSDQAEFTRGILKNVSVRSDGHVSLGPEFQELDSTTVPYLWGLAQDSKGTLYYAGGAPTGATAKIFALPRHGKPKVFAEIPGLEVHALAVDSQDRLYAAVLPDAKVYRIDRSGKPQLFFDPKCKYIWSMVFDHSGNLFVATGDTGLIYKVSSNGTGAKFFDTKEAHARSMIIDRDGNLIVGTEPEGLVMRITPQGKGFVLYQTNKREVTAVAEHDGVIYASAIGNKSAGVTVRGPSPVLPSNPAPVTPTGAPRVGTTPPILPPAAGSLSAAISGGSEFYRIQKDGFAERIWNSSTELIYAITFDSSGKPLLGTGNKGVIYRVDSDQLSTELLNTPPTQVTAFLAGKDGTVYAATGNVGNVYSIGPSIQKEGSLTSEVLDADDFTYWGKVHLTSTPHGGTITFETRSGNLNNPENDWSPWSKVELSELGGPVLSPPARFLQYRLTLARSADGESPDLSTVDIAYLPKNLAPNIQQIELAPMNYRQAPSASSLERSVMPSGSPATLTLPAVGQRRQPSTINVLATSGSATLQYNKGYQTVRWNASDPNGDPLDYKVEIRAKKQSVWHVLKDKLQDRYYAFDTTAFPDGDYLVRVTASDAPGNTPENALTCSLASDPFTIDNTPPEITNVAIAKNGGHAVIKFTAHDALSWLEKAEYSVDGGEWTLLQPVTKVSDSQLLNYQLEVGNAQAQVVSVRVFDENDNVTVKQFSVQ
jgi:hypothetical protein